MRDFFRERASCSRLGVAFVILCVALTVIPAPAAHARTASPGYGFSGFLGATGFRTLQPVIPMSFRLTNSHPQGLLAIYGRPYVSQVPCDGPPDGILLPLSAKAAVGTMQYLAPDNLYRFDWHTDSSWVNTCRTWSVRLSDGSIQSAWFFFKGNVRPINDTIESALPLTASPTTIWTRGATRQANEPKDGPSGTVWFTFSPSTGERFRIRQEGTTYHDFDCGDDLTDCTPSAKVRVFTGEPGSLSPVRPNGFVGASDSPGWPTWVFSGRPGVKYYVRFSTP
jgi:hypothetical protein